MADGDHTATAAEAVAHRLRQDIVAGDLAASPKSPAGALGDSTLYCDRICARVCACNWSWARSWSRTC